MNDPERINFFTDRSVQDDPYEYFDALRERSPIWQEPHYGVYMVTGYEEAMAIYNDAVHFSSCNAVGGPFKKFSVPLEGDDVSAIIEEHRDELPFSDQLPTFDTPRHTDHRRLLMRLLTPQKLRSNEDFMWRTGDRLMDAFFDSGTCEFIGEYAAPFTLLVVADLEGVPEEDHGIFRREAYSRRRSHRAQATRVPLRPVHCLYRGPQAQPPRRHHDRDGDSDLPGRFDARGQRRRTSGGEPVRRGPGDDRAPAFVRPEDYR